MPTSRLPGRHELLPRPFDRRVGRPADPTLWSLWSPWSPWSRSPGRGLAGRQASGPALLPLRPVALAGGPSTGRRGGGGAHVAPAGRRGARRFGGGLPGRPPRALPRRSTSVPAAPVPPPVPAPTSTRTGSAPRALAGELGHDSRDREGVSPGAPGPRGPAGREGSRIMTPPADPLRREGDRLQRPPTSSRSGRGAWGAVQGAPRAARVRRNGPEARDGGARGEQLLAYVAGEYASRCSSGG